LFDTLQENIPQHVPGHSVEQEPQTITSPISWNLERVSPSLHAVIKDLLLVAGTMDAHPTVADGVLVGLSLWGRSIINLVVECADGRYFGSIRAPDQAYDHVLHVSNAKLRAETMRSHGCRD
jgi:hypothetical protein